MATRLSFGSGKGGTGCLILFGLPFAGVGVVMAWLLFSTLVSWHSMRSWVETPARIVSADLEADSGDDGTTYRCTAKYTYDYGGRQFTGARVAIGSGADNIGSFQRDAYNELAQYRDSGQDFPCYVNPEEPSQAVLFRQLRVNMLVFYAMFVCAFGGVGFGLVFGGIWSLAKSREKDRLRAENPSEPWRWNPEAASGVIRSQSMAQMGTALAFAGLWNAISFPVSYLVLSDILKGEGEKIALLVLLFPLVGVLLAWWAIYTALQWRKYGSSVFRMASVPGVIGGKLSGVIEVGRKIRPEDGFHLTLSCVNRVTTGSGKNRSTREHVLWQNDRVMARELTERDPARTSIPVAFGIPYDCRETDDSNSTNQILWRLQVRAATSGVDYGAQFEAPVYKTEASRQDFVLDEAPLAPYLAEVDPVRDARRIGLQVTPLANGGVRIEAPAPRNVRRALGTTVFLVIWTGVLWALIEFDVPRAISIIVGVVNALIALHVLDLWLSSSRIEARNGALEFACGWFGGKRRALLPNEIAQIKPTQDVQVGSKTYYSLTAATTAGKSYTLAKRIGTMQETQAIIGLLQRAMGGADTEDESK